MLAEVRERHGLSIDDVARLARVEAWAWAYWEHAGCPTCRVGAVELVALKLGDGRLLAIVEMVG